MAEEILREEEFLSRKVMDGGYWKDKVQVLTGQVDFLTEGER